MLQDIGRYFSIGFGILGVVCWFGALALARRAWKLRKPGATRHTIGDLTTYKDAGVRAYKSSIACQIGFLVCWALGVGIGVATGAFKH
jgi:hypothetical protein